MASESLRLLLIEDNLVDACVIQGYLTHTNGLHVELEHAQQLSLGVAWLRERRFDATLLDLNLPDSVGLGTVDHVHACDPNVPIVVLTGEDADDLALQAVKAGAEDYICKSELEPKLLLRTIRYAIERAGRRRTDEKLRQSELRYRALFEESPDGVLLLDPLTSLPLDFNNAACRQLGYTREEFGRLRISDYEAHETPEETQAHIDVILRDGRADFETQHRRKTGEVCDVLVTVQTMTLAGRQLLHAICRDITDYRQAQAALSETEAKFHAFILESAYGYAELDRAGTFLFVNQRLAEIVGYSADEMLGRHYGEYVLSDDKGQSRANFEKAFAQQPVEARQVCKARTKSGDIKILVMTSVALYPQRRPARLLCLFLDVTEHRRAQEALQESEAKLRSLFENLPDLVLVLDRSGRIEFANRALPGANLQDLLGSDGFGYIVPEHRCRCREAHQQAILTGQVQTVEAVDIYGNWWACRFAPMVKIDDFHRVTAICTDITQHRKVELALGEREQRYRELLAAVTNYTYSVTLQYGVPVSTDHSWGCLSVTGYSPEDYKSDPYLWINMVHPDDQDMVRQYAAAILGGKKVPSLEHRIIRRDGAIRWLRDTIVPHHDGDMLVRYDGLVEDVTDRWNAEHALRENEVQLLAAQKIQQRLLPTESPTLPGFDIGGGLYPAEFTAGDFYDYLTMPNGRLGFVISDVLGHGFSSALLMASTSSVVRLLAETHTEVGEILGKVNCFLTKETDDQFVTLLLACLDPQSRSISYASGGHPPGYILDEWGAVKARLESTSLPLAISPNTEFPVTGPILLEPGDIVVLLTDGIHETMSPDGTILGIARVLDVVRANRTKTALEIVESLRRLVYEFCQRDQLVDDITAVVIKVEQ
jgi:PAS domain S-box-containing protein